MSTEKQGDIPQAEIGILGGTGLYEIDGNEVLEDRAFYTPFGNLTPIIKTEVDHHGPNR